MSSSATPNLDMSWTVPEKKYFPSEISAAMSFTGMRGCPRLFMTASSMHSMSRFRVCLDNRHGDWSKTCQSATRIGMLMKKVKWFAAEKALPAKRPLHRPVPGRGERPRQAVRICCLQTGIKVVSNTRISSLACQQYGTINNVLNRSFKSSKCFQISAFFRFPAFDVAP